MVVALDDETAAWLKVRDVANYVKVLRSRTGDTGNHATSGLKFKVLIDFLSVGCSVLLSDVDVIWLANPFLKLYRDADVEGMSDGWDEPTTYGYNDLGALRVFARNSGMFYLRATHEALRMVQRLAYRMETEGVWDQTAYNEEQFYPWHDGHAAAGVSSRVMPYFCNLNSKTFFRFVREDEALLAGLSPVSIHVNYHPEKPQVRRRWARKPRARPWRRRSLLLYTVLSACHLSPRAACHHRPACSAWPTCTHITITM